MGGKRKFYRKYLHSNLKRGIVIKHFLLPKQGKKERSTIIYKNFISKYMKKNTQQGFTLIEILVVLGIIAILAAIVLIAINPARQFAQARNTQRTSNINAILNAIGQYTADHQGDLPAGIPTGDYPDDAEEISDGDADLCDALVADYLPALPVDPENDDPIEKDDCDSYSTGYEVVKNSNGRVTVGAPKAELSEDIAVTR